MSDKPTSPFVINKVHVWIECEDDDGPKGLAIKVRKDLTNRERDELNDHYREHVVEYEKAWRELSPEERAKTDADGDTPRDREWQILAAYILEWNVQAETPAGALEDVPSPADGGPAVFELVTKDALDWMMNVVLNGYRITGKANGLRAA